MPVSPREEVPLHVEEAHPGLLLVAEESLVNLTSVLEFCQDELIFSDQKWATRIPVIAGWKFAYVFVPDGFRDVPKMT